MQNPDADMAEHWLAQSKRELARYPRSPAILTPESAKAIDLSGIHRMTDADVAAALREWGCAA